MKSAEVLGWVRLVAGIVIFIIFSGLYGCKGPSSVGVVQTSGGNSESPGSTTDPLVPLSTLGCSSFKTGATPGYVRGVIKFVDKEFDSGGFTGTTVCKPVKFSDVQIVRDSDSAVLASGKTDSLGRYSINGTSFLGETVYVRSLTSSANKKVSVKSGSSKAVYSVISNNFVLDSTGVVKDLGVSVTSSAARPFNVFSVLMDGAIFVERITGDVLPKSTTGIYPNNLDDGTYFSAPDIYICGGCSNDDDGWDDTVIMHEFGHFVASSYSLDHSQGGSHSLTGHFELPLTWSEGWATFFSSALRDFLGITSPEYYVDTNGTNGQNVAVSYEIETPASPSLTVGADNEVAVSAVLWDIYDSVNERGFDDISSRIGSTSKGIWDVFQNYLSVSTLVGLVSLEDFWDGWYVRGNGILNGTGDITSIFEARSVFYKADTAEPDDTSGSATTITVGTLVVAPASPGSNRTFYPSGDVDWFKFSYVQGNTYSVNTLDLGDGADPVIELYTNPSATTPVCLNDDISLTNVNAKLTVPDQGCVVSGTGTLYLKVFSSKDPTNPAEYGNYNITVTKQQL